MKQIFSLIISIIFISFSFSQNKLQTINKIVNEANNNSQLESLAHELMDQIGPRLTGTSQMLQAHDWVIDKYSSWGIDSKNEQFGQWRAWERVILNIFNNCIYVWWCWSSS